MVRDLKVGPGWRAARVINAAEMLRRAMGALDDWGWIKGNLHDDAGGSCALGAIDRALSNGYSILPTQYDAARQELLSQLQLMHPELELNTIPEINDHPAVVFEDVRAAFEKAALKFEEKV